MDADERRFFDPMDGFCIHADPSGVLHIPGPISAEAFVFLKNNRRVLYEEKQEQIRREQEEHDRSMNAYVQNILQQAQQLRNNGVREFAIAVDDLAALNEEEIGGANEWPFIDYDAVCEKCGKSPCEWIRYSHKACAYASRNIVRRENRTNYQVDRKQAHHRHQLFLMLSRMVNGGDLGEGSTEFPECVVNHVQALFPSTTDN